MTYPNILQRKINQPIFLIKRLLEEHENVKEKVLVYSSDSLKLNMQMDH